MVPLYLKLRNFKGILSGMGRKEIEIDYEKLPKGIIVFDAPTGTGKSTILDASTPYRILAYRVGNTYSPNSFNFHDHCIGDWEREFIFEYEGVRYRSIVAGNADAKKQEGYLFYWQDEKWIPMPGIDGKVTQYDQVVERLIGSPALFFVSCFRAQNAKGISEYSKSSVKDLFIDLLNILHLQAIGEKARRVKQDLSGRVDILMRDRAKAKETMDKEDQKLDEATEISNDMNDIGHEIDRLENTQGPKIQARINEIDVIIASKEHIAESRAAIEKEIAGKKEQIEAANTRHTKVSNELAAKQMGKAAAISFAKHQIAAIPDNEAKIAEKANVENAIVNVKRLIDVQDNEICLTDSQIADAQAIIDGIKDKEWNYGGMISKRNSDITLIKKEIENAEKAAETLKQTDCPLESPTCKLMTAAVASREALPLLKAKFETLSAPYTEAEALKDEISELRKTVADFPSLKAGKAKQQEAKAELQRDLKKLEFALADFSNAGETLAVLREVEKTIPAMEEEEKQLAEQQTDLLAELNAELLTLNTAITDLERQLTDLTDDTGALKTERADLFTALEETKAAIRQKREAQDNLKRNLGAVEESLRQIATAKESFQALNAQITFLNDEITDWGILEKAFGREGIPTLEIDDCGPQVSAYCNELLKIYDSGYSVKIVTQEEKAGNNGNKEVFDISVFDPVLDTWKSIKHTSGGQRAIYEDAVTKAISIYNKNASNRSIKSTFTDEKDSALDMDLRKYYFQVKRKVLELGGFDQEYCITHTEELKTLADAVIRLSKENGVQIITQ